jgi:hypothetical protein
MLRENYWYYDTVVRRIGGERRDRYMYVCMYVHTICSLINFEWLRAQTRAVKSVERIQSSPFTLFDYSSHSSPNLLLPPTLRPASNDRPRQLKSTLNIIITNSYEMVLTVECSDQPLDLAFHPSNPNLLAAGLVDGTIEGK